MQERIQTVLQNLLQNKRLPVVLTAIFALGILLILQRTWLTLSHPNTPIASREIHQIRIAPASHIADWHLFGLALSNTDLPETRLALVLQGTVVSPTSPNTSTALIAERGQPAKVYHIGDAIDGAVIKNIVEHAVVLEQAGTLTTLHLPIPRLLSDTL